MSSNAESHIRNYGEGSQLTNWILDSGATCHTTTDISDFIPGSFVETDKYIKVADDNLDIAKQTGQLKIEMCDSNGKPFIAMLYNVLLALDLCNRIFYIIALMNLLHT